MSLTERRIIKVYIAGPMRGYENNNHEEFDKAEKFLRSKRVWDPVSPARIDREAGVDPSNDMTKIELKEALKRDVDLVFGCDCLYMLRGWEHSEGARMEHTLATALNMNIYYQ